MGKDVERTLSIGPQGPVGVYDVLGPEHLFDVPVQIVLQGKGEVPIERLLIIDDWETRADRRRIDGRRRDCTHVLYYKRLYFKQRVERRELSRRHEFVVDTFAFGPI